MAIAFVSAAGTVSNTGSATISHTTGSASVNDVLVIAHANNFYNLSNMPTPTVNGSSTGVTAITNGTADGGANSVHMKTYTFAVTSGGTQSISVTETGTADEEKSLAALIFNGVDTTTMVDVAGATVSATAQDPHVLTAISPATSDAMLVAMLNNVETTGSYTAPGSMTERYDTNGGETITGANEQLSASGSTGTRTFDASSSVAWCGVLVALKTATAGGGPILTPVPVLLRPTQSGQPWR